MGSMWFDHQNFLSKNPLFLDNFLFASKNFSLESIALYLPVKSLKLFNLAQ